MEYHIGGGCTMKNRYILVKYYKAMQIYANLKPYNVITILNQSNH